LIITSVINHHNKPLELNVLRRCTSHLIYISNYLLKNKWAIDMDMQEVCRRKSY